MLMMQLAMQAATASRIDDDETTMPRGIEVELQLCHQDRIVAERIIGERVKLDGLVARPEWNGFEGVAEEYDEVTGRFKIRLDPIGSLEIEASKFVLVRFTNLLVSFSDDPN